MTDNPNVNWDPDEHVYTPASELQPPINIPVDNVENALTLQHPDSTDPIWDEHVLAAIYVLAPNSPVIRSLLAAIWVETNGAADSQGRGIGVQNLGLSDAFLANVVAGGIGYACDVFASEDEEHGGTAFIANVHNSGSRGLNLYSDDTMLDQNPTLAELFHFSTVAATLLGLNMEGDAAHNAIVIRNPGGNQSARALLLVDSEENPTYELFPESGQQTLNGPIVWRTTNTADIGGATDNRPRNIYAAGGVATKVVAHTPTDSDFANPVDGMIAVDSSGNKIWTRIGGVWKGVAVSI